MTAAKLKLLVFSVSGFTSTNIANILYDFCLLPVWVCYVIVNIWNLESHVHIADLCVPRETANGAKNPILHALQF
jgi:hypothetical protein